jgi:hypothetical protein
LWIKHFGCSGVDEPLDTSTLESEIQALQYISNHSELPVPVMFDYDLEPQNPIGFRYVLMKTLEGHPLGMPYTQIPSKYLETFATQFADYFVQLRTLSFPSIDVLKYDKNTQFANISTYATSRQYVHDIRIEFNEVL